MPKITVKDLIKNKAAIKANHEKTITLNVKSMGEFDFSVPSKVLIDDALEFRNGTCSDEFIISQCSKLDLSDKELLDSFGVKDSIALVGELFLPGEVKNIAATLLEKAGYNDKVVEEVDAIKN